MGMRIKNTYKSLFLNTAEHIAPIVNKPDDTDKKETARHHEVLASHDPEYQQEGHILWVMSTWNLSGISSKLNIW